MSEPFFQRRFDRVAAGILVVLALVFGAVVLISRWYGIPAPRVTSAAGETIVGGSGPIQFQFNLDIDRQSLQARVSFDPPSEGRWSWQNDRTAWFYPSPAFTGGTTINVYIAQGVRAQDGRLLKRDVKVSLQVRPAMIVYLGQAVDSPDLWKIDQQGLEPAQLTFTNGNVYDFAVSPDGEWIVYSVLNFRGGSDLYLIDLQGAQERLLFECGSDSCREPAWAPDSKNIAFTRAALTVPAENEPPDSYIYSITIDSGQAAPFFNNPAVRGMAPSFSPDGRLLGFYDLVIGAIRLVNLADGSSEVVPAALRSVGAWSPDSTSLIVADLVPGTFTTYAQLFKVNFSERSLNRLIENEPEGVDYSLPAWSPDGRWLLVGLRYVEGLVNKQVWLMRPDGEMVRPITQNPAATHAAYSWSPDGSKAVFQRFQLGASDNRPEIILWDFSSGEQQVLVVDGALPQWLP